MAFGFMRGWFGHPAEKPTGIYAIKSSITNTFSHIPIIGGIYKSSKVIGGIILLIIGYIIYMKVT